MKIPTATFLATVAGWAAPLTSLALWQLATTGQTTDIGATAFWVGLFVLIAWAAIVLPVMLGWNEKKIFSDIRFSWLGWAILAVGAYSAPAMVLLFPFFGRDVFTIAWYPVLMGCIAGIVFALLRRGSDGRKFAQGRPGNPRP